VSSINTHRKQLGFLLFSLSAGAFLGITLAFLAAFFFGGNGALISRPLIREDPDVVNYIASLTGLVATLVATVIFGQLGSLLIVLPLALIIFVIFGIFHFGLSRFLAYTAIKHIGANQQAILSPTSVLYSFAFAVIFLHEGLSFDTLIGGIMIILGGILMEAKSSAAKRKGIAKIGIATALLAALIRGITPVVVKFGLHIFPYFLSASLIAYISAFVLTSAWTTPRRAIFAIRSMSRSTRSLIILAGLSASIANLFRFGALFYAPVVIAVPIVATSPVFTILMTKIFAGGVELLNFRTITSIVLVVLGGVIVAFYSGIG
jgi:drug/metabolite transporter (DMT)-like permease